MLIALEGIDGSGTTTQAERLGAALDGALTTCEPSRGPVGLLLRDLLAGAHAPMDPVAVALLFAADRRDHLAREIEPALAAGRHVVTDRYVMSSLAYQSLSLERAFVAEINARARPADLTILLDVPAEVAEARRRARGGAAELFDRRELQERVAAAYRDEARELLRAGGRVCVVDGALSPDEVHRRIVETCKTCLAGARSAF
jgi:dTMP kinase